MRIKDVKQALLYFRPTQKSFESVKRTFNQVVTELQNWKVKIFLQQRMAKIVKSRQSFEILDGDGILTPPNALQSKIDVVISIGGDGAFIHSTEVAKRFDAPVLGINAGTLGFLTAYSKKEVHNAISALLDGLLTKEKRTRIHCEHFRNGMKQGEYDVFNEITVRTGASPRLLDLGVVVGGKSVARYKCDGVILCTPAGSTAYNMAAGGIIFSPEVEILGVTPICANGLTTRGMAFGDNQEIEVEFLGSDESDAILVADGITGCTLQVGDKIVVTRADVPSWVVPPNESVFAVMNAKIGWNR